MLIGAHSTIPQRSEGKLSGWNTLGAAFTIPISTEIIVVFTEVAEYTPGSGLGLKNFKHF